MTEDGVVLIESGLILDYAERLSTPERRLMPADPAQFAKTARVIGLAMAACEKTVQIIYEMNVRPADKRHQPWLDRVQGQLRAAYALLEAEVRAGGEWLHAARPMQADVSAAVAWRFTQSCLGDALDAGVHPKLIALSERAEALPPFAAAPPT